METAGIVAIACAAVTVICIVCMVIDVTITWKPRCEQRKEGKEEAAGLRMFEKERKISMPLEEALFRKGYSYREISLLFSAASRIYEKMGEQGLDTVAHEIIKNEGKDHEK